MNTPDGLDQIIATFGDPHSYIGTDGNLSPLWQESKLHQIALPFALPLDWNRAVTVTHMMCHQLLAETFEDVFDKIVNEGLQAQVKTFGGCFAYRPQRGSTGKLSTHTWGIAVDLNPFENQQGTPGNMNMDVVGIFREAGFKWGGDWEGPRADPMHFQFATGY